MQKWRTLSPPLTPFWLLCSGVKFKRLRPWACAKVFLNFPVHIPFGNGLETDATPDRPVGGVLLGRRVAQWLSNANDSKTVVPRSEPLPIPCFDVSQPREFT